MGARGSWSFVKKASSTAGLAALGKVLNNVVRRSHSQSRKACCRPTAQTAWLHGPHPPASWAVAVHLIAVQAAKVQRGGPPPAEPPRLRVLQ